MPDDVKDIIDAFEESNTAFFENNERMADDLRFLEGEGNQWPRDVKADRDSDGRPCL
jgi:hypothetical protein